VKRADLALADRWILSRLAGTVKQTEQALGNYEFAAHAQALYDLFWRDFCDWYLEAIKPTLKKSPAQQAVLRTVLDAILRLLHPVCPFVTEAIYEKVRGLARAGEVPGVTLAPAELLCSAGWPVIDASWRDESVEALFDRMQRFVTAIRDLREKQKVRPQKRPTLHTDGATAREIASVGGLVETMADLDGVTTDAPEGSSSVLLFEAREHRLSGLFDEESGGGGAEGEKARLRKQIEDLERSIETVEKRLANPGYAQKAPPHLVQQTRGQLAAQKAERDAARASLERLG
jgi:valyl-tRNA synthetase